MGEKEMTVERIAALEAKMDMILQTVNTINNSLTTHYVSRSEYIEAKRRLDKLENAPTRWLPIVIAGAALLWGIIKQ